LNQPQSRGAGVSCYREGLFVGLTALLERGAGADGEEWRPRSLADLDRDLSATYGLAVSMAPKMAGLGAVARDLGSGEIVHAQLTALFLRLPDPPALLKGSPCSEDETIELAGQLLASGILKLEWDPAQHPRWPAGSPDSAGGQFAPAGGGPGRPAAGVGGARLVPGQIAIPLPLEAVVPKLPEISIPSELLPPPIIPPNVLPRNPYPERPECVKELAEAVKYCGKLADRGHLGKHPYEATGDNFNQCVRGQVSEDCGGNIVSA
jgi:hypothetical protein